MRQCRTAVPHPSWEGRARRREAVGQEGAGQTRYGNEGSGENVATKETALNKEARAVLRGMLDRLNSGMPLPHGFLDDPAAERIRALRDGLNMSRREFAESFGLDPRTLQDWEHGRRVPDRAARVLLTVIEREPAAVARALRG